MAEYQGLPPEEKLPQETAAGAPGVWPAPEEGSSGSDADGRKKRSKPAARRRTKSALLVAAIGAALCVAIASEPVKQTGPAVPAETTEAVTDTEPDETAETEPEDTEPAVPAETTEAVTDTEPAETAETEPEDTEPAVLTDADRLVKIGTWKNAAESEWVHFDADGTGWWYDGTWFGRMGWKEDADSSVGYEASIAYIGPGDGFYQAGEEMPEKDGDVVHCAESSGSIALLPDEDRFTCPGLLFGEGEYLPDDTVIDSSAADAVRGKSAAQLVAGTVWHMDETSDLGIPCATSTEKEQIYTDKVYVESLDFSEGVIRLTTRDGGLLEYEIVDEEGYHTSIGEMADTLDLHFPQISDDKDASRAYFHLDLNNCSYIYRSGYIDGDVEYNNLHLLWGRGFTHESLTVFMLITSSDIRLCIGAVDWYPSNYTILSQ